MFLQEVENGSDTTCNFWDPTADSRFYNNFLLGQILAQLFRTVLSHRGISCNMTIYTYMSKENQSQIQSPVQVVLVTGPHEGVS